VIPFAGTAEYTFSIAEDYLILDPECPHLNGRIKNETRNVKM